MCGFVFTAEFVYIDLTSLKSVRNFAQAFKQRRLPLHVLVNNGRVHCRGWGGGAQYPL